MSRITYNELESTNKKLQKANEKLEKKLATANEQVEELRTALDDRATKDAENAESEATLELTTGDLSYEHRRRVAAENARYELEQKVHQLVQTYLPLEERREVLSHLRLDAGGKIA